VVALSALTGPSDIVAAVSLAVLAMLIGLTPTDRVMTMYLRKRQEIALILAMGAAVRAVEWTGSGPLSAGLHLASAAVCFLACSVSCLRLIRERHDR
jgi:hypothetical protein